MKGIIGIGIIFLIISFIRACKPAKTVKDKSSQPLNNNKTVDQQSIDALNNLSEYMEYFRNLDSGRQKQELVRTRRAKFKSPIMQEMFLQSMEDELLNQERSPEEDQELKQVLDQIDKFRTFSPQEQAEIIVGFKKRYNLNDPFYYGILQNLEAIIRESDNERYSNQ